MCQPWHYTGQMQNAVPSIIGESYISQQFRLWSSGNFFWVRLASVVCGLARGSSGVMGATEACSFHLS